MSIHEDSTLSECVIVNTFDKSDPEWPWKVHTAFGQLTSWLMLDFIENNTDHLTLIFRPVSSNVNKDWTAKDKVWQVTSECFYRDISTVQVPFGRLGAWTDGGSGGQQATAALSARLAQLVNAPTQVHVQSCNLEVQLHSRADNLIQASILPRWAQWVATFTNSLRMWCSMSSYSALAGIKRLGGK